MSDDDEMHDLFGSDVEEEEEEVVTNSKKPAPETTTGASSSSGTTGGDGGKDDKGDDDDDDEMKDLFGDEEEEEEDENGASSSKKQKDDGEAQLTENASYLEVETVVSTKSQGPGQQVFLNEAPATSSHDSKFVLVRFPNTVSIEEKPFDPETFEFVAQEEGEDEFLQVDPENIVRWRLTTDAEGNQIKESNSRLVRWSDGSLQLFVGSHEVLDVAEFKVDDRVNHLYSSIESEDVENSLLKQYGPITSKMSLQTAHGLKSKSHATLKQIVRQKHAKEAKLKRTHAQKNERSMEREKLEVERLLEVQERERRKLRTKRETRNDRGRVKMSENFLEEDDDDSEEEYGGGSWGSRTMETSNDRLLKAKRNAEASAGEEEEEDEDEEEFVIRKSKKKRKTLGDDE